MATLAHAALVWFRRDLREEDHAALATALAEAAQVFGVFVFDRDILDALPDRADRRVEFILGSVRALDSALAARGGGLIVCVGRAAEEIPRLAAALGVCTVYAHRDYEPQAKARDAEVAEMLAAHGRTLRLLKDQVIFDGQEVQTQAGTPYTVFTPYKNAWLKRLTVQDLAPYNSGAAQDGVPGRGRLMPAPSEWAGMPTLDSLGFVPTNLLDLGILPGMTGAATLWDRFRAQGLSRYGRLRDFPAVKGVSYLSVHLRFGTVSVRALARAAWTQAQAVAQAGEEGAANGAAVWLSELIWRDFYFMILDQFPHVVTRAFKPAYDAIVWETGEAAEQHFQAWCTGQTGYPLVDAAMRQLAHSGWMHNRLRMVVASFLTKDLGIDWRRGEAHFARHLNDFDLAANNGGWQWAASTGCDAQPYFRIFNTVTQSEKFDPDGKFIRRYVPELANVPLKRVHAPWLMGPLEQASCGVHIGRDYPAPIVDHALARARTLDRYSVVKAGAA